MVIWGRILLYLLSVFFPCTDWLLMGVLLFSPRQYNPRETKCNGYLKKSVFQSKREVILKYIVAFFASNWKFHGPVWLCSRIVECVS